MADSVLRMSDRDAALAGATPENRAAMAEAIAAARR